MAKPIRCPRRIVACLLGVLALGGQESSADAAGSGPVGFVRVRVSANDRTLATFPFEPFTRSVQALYAGPRAGSARGGGWYRILKWSPADQAYIQAVQVQAGDAAVAGPWVTGLDEPGPSDMTLEPGEGFWVENHTPQDVYLLFGGRVPRSDRMSLRLAPGMNLIGYPYATAASVSAAGLYDALRAGSTADRLFAYDGSQFRPYRGGDGRGWVGEAGTGQWAEFEIGVGYVYVRNAATALDWTESRPYGDTLLTSGLPRVLDMGVGAGGRGIRFLIACPPDLTGPLGVLCQEATPTNSFHPDRGWYVADTWWPDTSADARGGTADVACYWDRGAADGLFGRYYLFVRTDTDTDGDGVPDAYERFVRDTDAERVESASVQPSPPMHPVLAQRSFEVAGAEQGAESRRNRRAPGTRRTIHVDARIGNDAYDGATRDISDQGGPKQTVSAALAGAQDGDLIVVHPGAYRNVNVCGRDVDMVCDGDVTFF